MTSPTDLAPFHFIVPIRHPSGVARPAEQRAALTQLLRSLAAQTDARFLCHLAVNPEQDLPDLPAFARRVDVDLAPNAGLAAAGTVPEAHEAIRLDKGRRVRAAMNAVRPDDMVMVVDDDDLVSRSLVAFVLEQPNPCETLWIVDKGFGWTGGSNTAYPIDHFHRTCGSSLIVPAHRYLLREGAMMEAEDVEATAELGSHRLVLERDVAAGRPIGRVPFRAAVYRLQHANSSQVIVKRLGGYHREPAPSGVLQRARSAAGRLRRLLLPRPTDILREATYRYERGVPIATLVDEFAGLLP